MPIVAETTYSHRGWSGVGDNKNDVQDGIESYIYRCQSLLIMQRLVSVTAATRTQQKVPGRQAPRQFQPFPEGWAGFGYPLNGPYFVSISEPL